MKVSGSKGSAKVAGSRPSRRSTKSSQPSLKPVTRSVGDSLEVSDHHATLEVIRELVSETPDIRVDEVERVIDQLKRGKYKFNFEKIAEGFIKEAILSEISKRPRKLR